MSQSRQRMQDGTEPDEDTYPIPVSRLQASSNAMGRRSSERHHGGGVTGAPNEESGEGSQQQPQFVTPPRLNPSSRRESASSGPSAQQGSGAPSIDSQESSAEESEDTTSANGATAGARYTVPLDRLYGRHKVMFTPEEDEALIRSLWHITKTGEYRSSSKWKNVVVSGGGALSRRTPLALKDRYRILSVHPKLLDEYPDLQRKIVKINRLVGYASTFVSTQALCSPRMSSSSTSSAKATAAAEGARALKLFHKTPLLYSMPLSSRLGKPVYVKLDAMQPSGSYKDRGVGHLCFQLKEGEGKYKQLISSSGGNAGLAVATVGRQLSMPVQVVVPKTTKPFVVDKLKSLDAMVTVHGKNWNEADLLARQLVDESTMSLNGKAAYISPYDHPLLWTGHSSLVDELIDDLDGVIPGAIVVSVGGGGLICGVLEGFSRHNLHRTAVIAAETEGAASFGYSFRQNKLVRLEAIKSIATSLGALEVTPVALERAKQHQSNGGVVREVICSDAQAVDACWEFARDHRVLVEPACGAALATVYSKEFHEKLQDIEGPIVVEICGGSGVTIDLLQQWKSDVGTP